MSKDSLIEKLQFDPHMFYEGSFGLDKAIAIIRQHEAMLDCENQPRKISVESSHTDTLNELMKELREWEIHVESEGGEPDKCVPTHICIGLIDKYLSAKPSEISETFDEFYKRIFRREPSSMMTDDGDCYYGDSETAHRVWWALKHPEYAPKLPKREDNLPERDYTQSQLDAAVERLASLPKREIGEVTVLKDEELIQLIRPYLHFGRTGWRRVAEKCLEVLRPHLRDSKLELITPIPDNTEVREVLTWAHNVTMCCDQLPSDDAVMFPVKTFYLRILCEVVEKLRNAKNVRALSFIKKLNSIEAATKSQESVDARLVAALKDALTWREYESEYDGRTYKNCSSCDGEDGKHKNGCMLPEYDALINSIEGQS